jgi:hypothetical protein
MIDRACSNKECEYHHRDHKDAILHDYEYYTHEVWRDPVFYPKVKLCPTCAQVIRTLKGWTDNKRIFLL